MELGIDRKIGLITGAGRGLGAEIARNLAREGVTLILVSRGNDSLDELLKELNDSTPNEHMAIALDLMEESAPAELLSIINEKYPNGVDIVINNVGGNLGHTDVLASLSDWREVMRLNVEIAVELNNELIPKMCNKNWGRVCHITSIAALENQGPPAYCAAKAALNAYVRSVGRWVSKDNVSVTAVMPGAVLTEGGYWDDAQKSRPDHVKKYLNERMAIQRFGLPSEISELVAFLCSQHSSFFSGSCFLADGGQGRGFYPSP